MNSETGCVVELKNAYKALLKLGYKPFGFEIDNFVKWLRKDKRHFSQLYQLPSLSVVSEGCIDQYTFSQELYFYKGNISEQDIQYISPHEKLGGIYQCGGKNWCIGPYGAPFDDDSFISASYSQTGYFTLSFPELYTQVTASFESVIEFEEEGEFLLFVKSIGWTDLWKLSFWANNCSGWLDAIHKVTVTLPSPPNPPVPLYGDLREASAYVATMFWSTEPLGYATDDRMGVIYYPSDRGEYEPHELQLDMRVVGPCRIVIKESMIYKLRDLLHSYLSFDEGTEAQINGEWVPVPYGFEALYEGLNGEFQPVCYKISTLPW
jgi:hypothetical protein